MKRSLLRTTTAWVIAAALLNPIALSPAAFATSGNGPITGPYNEPVLTVSPQSGSAGAQAGSDPAAQGTLSMQEKIALMRQKVKYVFVLFQENRSFDFYFGTYPGANGLFSTYEGANPSDPYARPASRFRSFNSVIQDTTGAFITISPFLIPRTIQNYKDQTVQLYPEDTYSVDHSHSGYLNDFHFDPATEKLPANDGYPLDQEGLYYSTNASGTHASATIYSTSTKAPPTSAPSLATKQKGEVVISHVDCDTIPFLWQYADRFTLFDNFHQTATGPSTPNAIAMIAGQVGDTLWVQTGAVGYGTGSPSLSVPNLTDNGPFAGSSVDTASGPKPPYGPDESTNPNDPNDNFGATSYLPPNPSLTFATLPLSFMGPDAPTITSQAEYPSDLAHIQNDIKTIQSKDNAIPWRWYQQGYGPEPFDGTVLSEGGQNSSNPPTGGAINFGGICSTRREDGLAL